MAEKLDILKGPGNPQFGNFMGFDLQELLSFKENAAFLRLIKTVDAIQKTGFTGTVGSDDGKDFSWLDPGGDPGKDIYPAKGLSL
jgi:hypothetical protein